MWFMVLSPEWRRHINICQMNGWTWSENVPYQPKGNQLPIQSTAKSFPKCITSSNTLNNPALKYIEGNGVWGRLMENYQPRMKASWVLDLLHAFPFYYANHTIIVFITAARGTLCEQFIDILLFSLHLSIAFIPFKLSVIFFYVTVYFITKMVSRYLKS